MKKSILLLLAMHFAYLLSAQTPGSVDLSFGNNGVSFVDFNNGSDFCYASAVQSDHKIILAGETYNESYDMAFSRLNPDGSMDETFASNGILNLVFNGSDEHIYDVVMQEDGKILALGYFYDGEVSKMTMLRLTSGGVLDPSFSSNGMLIIDFGPGTDSFGESMIIQEDGKILILGFLWDLNGDAQCAMARINPNGYLDNSFGTNGLLIMDFLSYGNYTNNISFQGQKFIVSGISYHDGDFYLILARFYIDGTLDSSFGIEGIVSIELNIDPSAFSPMGSMCIDAENRILYGLYFESIGGLDFALYRFTEEGLPDNNFGDYGLVVTDMAGDQTISAVEVQGDGKILATGSHYLMRYLDNGNMDLSFGESGTGVAYLNPGDKLKSIDLQDDGLILVCGAGYENTDSDFMAVRYYSGTNVSTSEVDYFDLEMDIRPNPASDHINISFHLDKKQSVDMELINSSGKTVFSFYPAIYPEGEHQLSINSQELAIGIYVLQIKTEGRVFTKKVVIP